MKAISVLFFFICIGYGFTQIKRVVRAYKIYKDEYNEYLKHFISKDIANNAYTIFLKEVGVLLLCLLGAICYVLIFFNVK